MEHVIFEARGVDYRYPGAAADAVAAADLTVAQGELVGIVGPNGSGKTTLLRLLLGALAPTAGQVLAFGQPATGWRRRELARRVAVVVQREEPVFPLRVREAVTLGRYPHVGPFQPLGARDAAVVATALARADATDLADRWIATLSGGEWQRVRIARALAQEPQALVLDEATANLDIRHEMEAFELVADLVRGHGLTGVLVSHHVNLVARFADRVIVLARGRVVAAGPPDEALTGAVVERVFEWPVDVLTWRGMPQFVPVRRRDAGGRLGRSATEGHEMR
jgi:iron complex transport system ATP-binding protein